MDSPLVTCDGCGKLILWRRKRLVKAVVIFDAFEEIITVHNEECAAIQDRKEKEKQDATRSIS